MAIDCAYAVEGQGPALFMIHGIGSRKGSWAEMASGLKSDYTCIMYDLRGHGDSPLPTEKFGLDDLVDDLEALRARLGINKAHFIGHSLGGMIGPAYARRFPDRVLSLGLLSTAAFRTEDDSSKVKAVPAAMREKGIPNVLSTLTARWFTDEFLAAHPEAVEARLQQVVATNPDVFLNVFDIYAGTEMSPWLHEIKARSLVLTGEFDGGCNPRLNKQIADALPNSKLVILDGLRHSILIEATPRVLPHIKELLASAG
jgi:pimeloyl-ACP methyl ester carboxylesterase